VVSISPCTRSLGSVVAALDRRPRAWLIGAHDGRQPRLVAVMVAEEVRLDVVTVNYRSAAEIQRLSADLQELAVLGIAYHLVVVDCSGEMASDADSADMHVIDPGRNLGYGAACNLALTEVTADVTALLNPDLLIDPTTFAALVRAGCSDGAIAWTGVLHNDDGSVQRNTAPPFTLGRLAAEYLLGVDTSFAITTTRRIVTTISGAVLLIRTAALRQVAGFDPQYPLYVEDVDLTERLSTIGPVVQYPMVVAVHLGGRSSAHAPTTTTTLLHASRIRWFQQQGRGRGFMARSIVVTGCAVRWIVRPTARRSLNPLAIWTAGAASYQLAALLPPRVQ